MDAHLWQVLCAVTLMAGLVYEEYVSRPTGAPPAAPRRRTAAKPASTSATAS